MSCHFYTKQCPINKLGSILKYERNNYTTLMTMIYLPNQKKLFQRNHSELAFGSILEPTRIPLAIFFLKLKKRSGVYRIYFFPPLDLQFSRVRHCQVFRVMKNWRQRPPSFSLFVFSNSLFSISTSLSCCSVIYNIVRVPLRLFSFFFFCLSPCTSTPLWLIRLFIYLSVVHFCTHKPLDV